MPDAAIGIVWQKLLVTCYILAIMSALESKVFGGPLKDQVRTLLNQLPDNCTIEDVQYGLYVLETIRQGKESIDRGEGIPHEEVERRMQQWLTK